MCTLDVARSILFVDVMRHFSRTGITSDLIANRQSGALGPRNVKRQLFDETIDHVQTAKDLQRETETVSKEANSRWNFNFQTETPMEGRFEWSPTLTTVSKKTSTSSTHHQSSSSPVSTGRTEDRELLPTVKEITLPCDRKKSAVQKNSKRIKTKIPSNLVQRKLTDYMTQRKRPAATKMISSIEAKVKRKMIIAATATSCTHSINSS